MKSYALGLLVAPWLLLGMVALADVKRSSFNITDPNSPQMAFLVVGTASELPPAGNQLGDTAFASDSTKHYRWNGVAWISIVDDGGPVTNTNFSATGIGSTGTITAEPGSTDGSGQMILTPGGAGLGRIGTATLVFVYLGTNRPVCLATLANGTGAWVTGNDGVYVDVATSPSLMKLDWVNNNNLIAGSTYKINYICRRK